MRVVVATLQRGRHGQLRNVARGLLAQTVAPERVVVVSMDPPEEAPPLADWPADGPPLEVDRLPVADGAPLPLAAARNRAAARAEAAGAELLVMLDVDCIPSPRLIERYAEAARATGGAAILLGPVGRLAAGDVDSGAGCLAAPLTAAAPTAGLAPPRASAPPLTLPPATLAAAREREPRPFPPATDGPEALARLTRPELFWSLSYALAPTVHRAAGGYDEGYVGYGGEDTDFAVAAARAGVELWTVGGAWAYHQHHPVSSPPREHLDAIVVNARRFHARWGWWPMGGWLTAFAAEGLIDWREDGDAIALRRAGAPTPLGAAAKRF